MEACNCKYICTSCGKVFKKYLYFIKHGNECHLMKFYQSKCKYCGKIYNKRGIAYLKHIKLCEKQISNEHKEHKTNRTYTCCKCLIIFKDRKTLYTHHAANHQRGRGDVLQSIPWRDQPAPWENQHHETIDPELKQVYELHIPIYLESHKIGNIQSLYNFPIQNNFNLNDIRQHLNFIYHSQTQSFKLNVMFGLILKSVADDDNGRYRAWLYYKNDYLFTRNLYISKRAHLERAIERMKHMDITNYIMQQRDSTKWIPYLITNVNYDITSTGFVLGGYIQLPPYILRDMALISMNKPYSGNSTYTDSLCLFRCLTYHKHSVKCYKVPTVFRKWVYYYFNNYVTYQQERMHSIDQNTFSFAGVEIEALPNFEKCFGININLYNKKEDETCTILRQSLDKYGDTVNLQEYMGHLSYIANFANYAKKKLNVKDAQKYLEGGKTTKDIYHYVLIYVKYSYPGGYFTLKRIFLNC